MAIIKCPECQKDVSEMAAACPFCGYGVAAHVQKENEERQAYEEFVSSHKPISFTDRDWLLLFKVYDYALARLKITAKELPKFRNIYFGDGVPSYPIGFSNSWWNCLCDSYKDICKAISADLSKLSISTVASNARSITSVNVGDIIRPIMLRWNRLIMEPFEKNSPAILRNAEHQYNLEVAENSSMGFGIITNSFTSMALYAVQASMKEVRAETKAYENKQAYINQSMSYLQQNVTRAWNENFDKFIEDTEFCHQIFLFEIGQKVFDGYLFTWKMVDDEFIKPERQEKYRKLMREIEEKQKAETAAKHEALKTRRDQFITAEQLFVDKAQEEHIKLDRQIEELGFALFGEKGRKRKELVAERKKLVDAYSKRKHILDLTKGRTEFRNHSYTFTTHNRGSMGEYEVRDRTVFDVIYDTACGRYALYDAGGKKVCNEVGLLHDEVGAFKQFKATYSNCITSFGNGVAPDTYEIFLKLTSDY